MADIASDTVLLGESDASVLDGDIHSPSNGAQPHYRVSAYRLRKAAGPANDNSGELDIRPLVIAKPAFEPRKIQLAIKRIVDILGAGVSLVVLFPLLLVVAALIRLESEGSPLFRQRRTGINGVLFDIVKFRSMHVESIGTDGSAHAVDDHRRITRVGRFLRKTNLDELPQLWNVLVGDMSLVGPRPHVPGMLAAGKPYDELVTGYEHRHLMRPGLTGLAQARGLRGPTGNRSRAVRRIICDVEYVKNFSIALDARIMIRTVANEFKGGTGS